MKKYFDIKKDNCDIKCRLCYKDIDNIKSIIFSCHGFTGDKDNKTSNMLADYMLNKYDDVAVFSFDLPCHGNDSLQLFDLNTSNDYFDVIIDYLKNDLGVTNIYSQGISLGGYLILKYISEHGNPFKKIALRCPAVNMYDALTNIILTKEQLDLLNDGEVISLGDKKKISFTNDFVNQLRDNNILERNFNDFSKDILIVHGTDDILIDYETDKNFSKKNNITFVGIEGADHGFNNIKHLRKFVELFDSIYEKTK